MFSTYRSLLASGLAPNQVTFSILCAAAARSAQPQRAEEVLRRLVPAAGLEPGAAVWNGVLGAWARAGDLDRVYATWEAMLAAGAPRCAAPCHAVHAAACSGCLLPARARLPGRRLRPAAGRLAWAPARPT